MLVHDPFLWIWEGLTEERNRPAWSTRDIVYFLSVRIERDKILLQGLDFIDMLNHIFMDRGKNSRLLIKEILSDWKTIFPNTLQKVICQTKYMTIVLDKKVFDMVK